MLRQNGAPKRKKPAIREVFSTLKCERVEFKLRTAQEKFHFETFLREFIGRRGEFPDEAVLFGADVPTRNPEEADYHVEFEWYLSKQEINFSVEYIKGVEREKADEREPFAETFMQWLGAFFKNEQITAHIHAAFEFPQKNWESIVPLPIKVPIKTREAEIEIEGMSFGLGKLYGASQAWIMTWGEDTFRVLIAADRKVIFKEFSIDNELQALSSVAQLFVTEKRNEGT